MESWSVLVLIYANRYIDKSYDVQVEHNGECIIHVRDVATWKEARALAVAKCKECGETQFRTYRVKHHNVKKG
jgi:hypothetical protein